MALEGSLKEFGLADILQLIYFQRKTGVLTISGRQDQVRLLFNNGNVIFAASKVRDESLRTGRMLVKRGYISSDDLSKALSEQKGVKLGAYLIRSGLVAKEQVQEALTVQITETVVQLFSWKEGRYEFKPQGVPVDRDIGLSIDTQHLLMEGLRLLDEWSLLKDKLSMDSVIEKTGRQAGELSPDERSVLELVDGESDVSAIAGLSGMDGTQVSKALIRLLDDGLIRRKEAVREAPKTPETPLPAAPSVMGKVAAASAIAAFSIALLSLFWVKLDIDEFRASSDMDGIRLRIEAEKRQTGSYPPSVEEADPWGNLYFYEVKEDGFVLWSAGADSVAGTRDDIY